MRKLIAALAVGALVAGGIYGAAASLGGVNSNTLGASSTVVAACDTDGVATAYTTAFDTSQDRIEVTDVVVSGIAAACNGLPIKVFLTNDNAGTIEGSGQTTTAAPSTTVSIPGGASSQNIENVHVQIGS